MNIKSSLPLVSVVTPVYNGEQFLDECIRSVLSQTYQNWEMIVHNNASTDNTIKIAEKYASQDDRIRITNTDALLPIMDNWNLALRQMSPQSKYCKVVHADDLLFSQCLEKMVSIAEVHPTIGMVGSYGLSGNRVVCRGLPLSTVFLPGTELGRLTLLNRVNPFWSPSSLLIRSDLIRKRRNYYDGAHLHADVEACYETLKESDFGFVHQILTFIRAHEDSMTSLHAAPFNRTIVSNLDLFLRLGPSFMRRSEFNRHLELKLRQYYQFLSNSLFQLREKKFWRFHQDSFEQIGLKFRYSRLIHAALRKLISSPLEAGAAVFTSAKPIMRRDTNFS